MHPPKAVAADDLVLVSRDARADAESAPVGVPQKLLSPFHGPYRVTEVRGSTVWYTNGKGEPKDVHLNDVKVFNPPQGFTMEPQVDQQAGPDTDVEEEEHVRVKEV